MPYQTSNYAGDATYSICCTGDCVTGDRVCFERATFSGSFRNAKFAGFERIEGEIVNDSYGQHKQQHTFTLLLADGSKMTIKGRNLYANGCWRKAWTDESQRHAALNEKHARGDNARKARQIRIEERVYGY
ncbi:MAG: hypothetical protein ACREHG_06905 [Candidatus Saccharimonadales bacterium]